MAKSVDATRLIPVLYSVSGCKSLKSQLKIGSNTQISKCQLYEEISSYLAKANSQSIAPVLTIQVADQKAFRFKASQFSNYPKAAEHLATIVRQVEEYAHQTIEFGLFEV